MSFETPPQQPVAPEKPPKPHEAFLSKDLQHLNIIFHDVFEFFDGMPEEERESAKDRFPQMTAAHADEADPDAMRSLRFQEMYGQNVFENAMRAGDRERPLTDAERTALNDYQEFLALFDHPEHRPRLLSKLAPMHPEDASWYLRRDFTRFLYEFYGREKVIGKDENDHERGFLSLEGQADLVEAWNIKGNWGFTERQFDDIRNQIPEIRERMNAYEDEPLVAPVLTPCLPDKDGIPGVHRTFTELRHLMDAGQEKNWHHDVYDNSTNENLRLRKGLTHTPGLAFEILGLKDNQGKSPDSIRSKAKKHPNLPHASILAAAALHPEWVQAMDGDEVPYANISGYEVSVPADEPWRRVPYVLFFRHDRLVGLSADSDAQADGRWSVPSSRE